MYSLGLDEISMSLDERTLSLILAVKLSVSSLVGTIMKELCAEVQRTPISKIKF